MLPLTLAESFLSLGEIPAYELYIWYRRQICLDTGSAAVSGLKGHVHVDPVVADVSVSAASDGKKKLEDKNSSKD